MAAEPSGNGAKAAGNAVMISDAAIDRALDKILELEKPYFRPGGALAGPSVGLGSPSGS